jgi:DNA repair and recombination protein RAD52
MFNQKQLETLNSALDTNRIKTRNKGNIQLSYIEGHSVIETANNVFGFGNWDYTISKLEQVSQEMNQNQNNVVCYKATVQVLVHNENHSQDVSREDVGFGTGVAKTLADAHEGAAKEAVTDALKRALRSFGNQFGNSLYSKDKNHTNNGNYQNQQNYSQQSANNNYQQYQKPYPHSQDFHQLTSLGLNIVETGDKITVQGDKNTIISNKELLKSLGFRFDFNGTKQWYILLRQAA